MCDALVLLVCDAWLLNGLGGVRVSLLLQLIHKAHSLLIFLDQRIEIVLNGPNFSEFGIESFLEVLLMGVHRVSFPLLWGYDRILPQLMRISLILLFMFGVLLMHWHNLKWEPCFTPIIVLLPYFAKYDSRRRSFAVHGGHLKPIFLPQSSPRCLLVLFIVL